MIIRLTTSFLSVALMLGSGILSACSKHGRAKRESLSLTVHSMKNIDNEVGKNVTVRGTAQNAKLGAIVLIGESAIYVAGLDGWNEKLVGKEIEVTGTLTKSGGPSIQTNEFGGVSAGTGGPIYTLLNPKISGQ
jgi:hypothetical protein